MNFEKELEQLINRYSKENESNTPDWLLAEYIRGCLSVYSTVVLKRDKYYGRGKNCISDNLNILIEEE